MQLTEVQLNAVTTAATSELRSARQMLSLLLAEGIRFYFMDREPVWCRVNPQELAESLINEVRSDC